MTRSTGVLMTEKRILHFSAFFSFSVAGGFLAAGLPKRVLSKETTCQHRTLLIAARRLRTLI